MPKVGYRTIKTAIGAAVAIAVAEWLQLDFYASAAILAILCISITKKSSLLLSWQRFAACMLGLFLSFLLFEVLGYHPFTLGVVLLLFIPIAVRLQLKEGIVTSAVIILHIYTLKTVIQGLKIAEFIDALSVAVGPENNASHFLNELELMRKEFAYMPLPETRKEFEIRSSLLYVMNELEHYLHIKDSLKA